MKFKLFESQQNTDNQGNELSQEQIRFFQNSKVRDSHGRLMVCYHGTDSNFDAFEKRTGYRSYGALIGINKEVKSNGFFFSDDYDFASQYGRNVRAFYLNVTHPLFNKGEKIDVWTWADNSGNNLYKDDKKVNELHYILEPIIPELLGEYKMSTYEDAKEYTDDDTIKRWQLRELWEYYDGDINKSTAMPWDFLDANNFSLCVDRMKELGYNGILVDEKDDNPNSWFILESIQAKLITNKTPGNSDNINEEL